MTAKVTHSVRKLFPIDTKVEVGANNYYVTKVDQHVAESKTFSYSA